MILLSIACLLVLGGSLLSSLVFFVRGVCHRPQSEDGGERFLTLVALREEMLAETALPDDKRGDVTVEMRLVPEKVGPKRLNTVVDRSTQTHVLTSAA